MAQLLGGRPRRSQTVFENHALASKFRDCHYAANWADNGQMIIQPKGSALYDGDCRDDIAGDAAGGTGKASTS